MEGDQQHHYELRSRSRSRSHTPAVFAANLRESESSDRRYDLRSKSRERSITPAEVTSSGRSGTRSLPGSTGKQRDKSMDVVDEARVQSKNESMNDDAAPKRSESRASSGSKKIERRSERQRVKRQIFSNGQNDAREDSLDDRRSVDKPKSKSVTPRRTITSDYSSEEGDKEDPPSRPGSAYEIYKQAGDWWNVFPKTDYTYSQKSQFRYEIAPGVLAMPNMSRPSIHSDGNSTTGSVNSLSQQNLSQCSRGTGESFGEERSYDGGEARDTIEDNRINEMNACRLFAREAKEQSSGRSVIYKKTHVEHYNRHREIIYGDSGRSLTRERYVGNSQVDSDTELDEAVSLRHVNRHNKWMIVRWLENFRSTVVMWLSSVFQFVGVKNFNGGNVSTSHDYHRYRESKWRKVWAPIDRLMHYLYLLLIRILFLDTWFLSRASTARQQLRERRTKLLWLILLPPLLLAGFWCLSRVSEGPFLLSLTSRWTRHDSSMTPPIVEDKNHISSSLESQRQYVPPMESATSDENIEQLVESLANRIEKLEIVETDKSNLLANVTNGLEILRKNDETIWNNYNNRIEIIEKNLDDREIERSNEIEAMRLEFRSLKNLYESLKICCDTSARLSNVEEMDKQVERVINDYFGTGMTKDEIRRVFQSIVRAKNEKQFDETTTSLSDDDMRRIVNEVLKIYDADKTGKVDYALESAGGQIISTRCTQRYNVNTRAFKLLGFTLYYESNNPRTVIQGNSLQPGACWAFQDFPGYLLIKLRSSVMITGFTVEHVSRSILPNSEIRSAPRKFNVWGLKDENDAEPVMFGDYEFLDSDDSLQYFPVQNVEVTIPYEYVELRIHSNHGQLEYTCLYRFRVHGTPV